MNEYIINGNFISAIEKLKKDLGKDNISFVDKIALNNELEYAERLLKRLEESNSVGEAFFPAIGSQLNIVYTFTLSEQYKKEYNNNFYANWEKVKQIVTDFLNYQLKKKKIPIIVFSWGIDAFYPNLKNFLSDTELTQKNITGHSLQLAMAIALLSKIVNRKVKVNYAFSGELNFDGNNLKIIEVESIERKEKLLGKERPFVKRFVHSGNTSDFGQLAVELFGDDYLESVQQFIVNNALYLSVGFESSEALANDKKINVTKINFHHGEIPSNSLVKLADFLSELKFPRENLIINELKPNFATAMLASQLKNNFSGFIAFANPSLGSTNEYINGAVITDIAKGSSNYKKGTLIYFK